MPASIASIAASDEEPVCRRAAAHAAGSSASRSVASSIATGRPIVGLGRGGEPLGGQLRRRVARVDEVAHGAADDLVRAAVVELAREREDVGDVGRGDEALARDLREALGPELDPLEHGRGQPCDRDGLVERARHGAVEQVEVVGSRRARVQRGERARRGRPAAWPAWVRIAASAYGFFFCGISALARLCASASSTSPNSWLA